MLIHARASLALLIGVFIFAGTVARAQVTLLNYPFTIYEVSWTTGIWAFRPALAFTTSNTSFSVDSVSLRLKDYSAPDSPSVGFYTNSSNVPGTLVGGLLNNPAPNLGASADFVFTAGTPITLAANTSYFLLLSTTDTSSFYTWQATISAVPTGLFTPNFIIVSNAEAAFQAADFTYVGGLNITGTAVPEPSTYAAVAGLAALGLAMYHRRKLAA